MRYALLSDIHSNLEALETAVEHAKSQKIDSWVVLGDTVGYGANPNECFEWALRNASIYIVGNHEKAVTDLEMREWFSGTAREAIVWTARVMSPKLKKEIDGLAYLRLEKNMTFVHGSPYRPEEFHYLRDFQDAVPSFAAMENNLCFVGHTHIPSCICENRQSEESLTPGVFQLKKGERYILNPGSVGQPRDRDPRLAYGIFDDEKQAFEIFRLDYDNQKAADKIRKAGLPQSLADRLL
jgi:predicted phosphodiesterase